MYAKIINNAEARVVVQRSFGQLESRWRSDCSKDVVDGRRACNACHIVYALGMHMRLKQGDNARVRYVSEAGLAGAACGGHTPVEFPPPTSDSMRFRYLHKVLQNSSGERVGRTPRTTGGRTQPGPFQSALCRSYEEHGHKA